MRFKLSTRLAEPKTHGPSTPSIIKEESIDTTDRINALVWYTLTL